MYVVLAGLICTTNKWANYRPWQFPSPFTAKTMLWNGNSLICWTRALSLYITAQLMCWYVIQRVDKRLAGTSVVQTIFTNL